MSVCVFVFVWVLFVERGGDGAYLVWVCAVFVHGSLCLWGRGGEGVRKWALACVWVGGACLARDVLCFFWFVLFFVLPENVLFFFH